MFYIYIYIYKETHPPRKEWNNYEGEGIKLQAQKMKRISHGQCNKKFDV